MRACAHVYARVCLMGGYERAWVPFARAWVPLRVRVGCVHVCVCACVRGSFRCMRVCVAGCVHAWVRACMGARMDAWMGASVYGCVHGWVRACVSITQQCLQEQATRLRRPDDEASSKDGSQQLSNDEQPDSQPEADFCVQCPKCDIGFTGGQPKVNLCKHLNEKCIPKLGALTEPQKARLRTLDLAACKRCGKWMARRSAHGKKHALKCKFDSQAPGEANDDDDGPVKPGRFGTYGDDIPQFVMDVFGATQDDPNFGLATWLSTFDEPLADMQPYGLAPHSLRVPQGTDHHISSKHFVSLWQCCAWIMRASSLWPFAYIG